MDGESKWVSNGILSLALIVLVIPLASGVVGHLDSLLLVIRLMYVV